MNRNKKQWVNRIRSIVLALLIAIPPVYQSLHDVFSHQHEVACCSTHHENAFQQYSDPCEVISFQFYSQVHPGWIAAVSAPVFIPHQFADMVPVWFTKPVKQKLNPRAPPFSC